MRILFIGDIVGKPGRQAALNIVPKLIKKEKIDLVIANSENAASGKGITKSVLKDLFDARIDVLTSGNHAWDKKEGIHLYDSEEFLLRPANYPQSGRFHVPGRGHLVFETKTGVKVGILNLMGRVFMDSYDCPFQKADLLLEELHKETKIVFVDFHAETTAEKKAMALYLDGRISAIIGTHTHVQTADEQVLKNGTGFLTDAGMTGPHDSVIGMAYQEVIEKFLTRMPKKYEVASGDVKLQGVVMDINETTAKTERIERVSIDANA
ncbi:MAG: metallophosphoesterase [Deltaproteobacteria bacterium RIFCSPHIGHO2_02_FULL_40_11]|nr:MAG: metallophosphoesterase [Deltaproteobacteria bacterium RIFCSPHIGHO2_02_FULL_40_11]